jgi:hypothetical protein
MAKGTYVYAQATPLLSYHQDTLSGGVRLGVGYSSPAYLAFLREPDSNSFHERNDEVKAFSRVIGQILFSFLGHGELVYQYERERGRSLGFLFGLGF